MGKIIRNGREYSGSSDKADKIHYNGTTVGLNATTVQGAVDEVMSKVSNDMARAAYSTNLMAPCVRPTFIEWDVNTLNTPYTVGLTTVASGFAIVDGDYNTKHTIIAWTTGMTEMFMHSVSNGQPSGWSKFVSQSDFNILSNDVTQINNSLSYYYGFVGGIDIPDGADMKSAEYLVPGNYRCGSSEHAQNLTNCPVNVAFTMKVEYGTGSAYPIQTFRTYDDSVIASRMYEPNSGTWTSDKYYASKSDVDQINNVISLESVDISNCSTLNAIVDIVVANRFKSITGQIGTLENANLKTLLGDPSGFGNYTLVQATFISHNEIYLKATSLEVNPIKHIEGWITNNNTTWEWSGWKEKVSSVHLNYAGDSAKANKPWECLKTSIGAFNNNTPIFGRISCSGEYTFSGMKTSDVYASFFVHQYSGSMWHVIHNNDVWSYRLITGTFTNF